MQMLGCISFFFFKQKTAYEMRISDWSSDVCSSDLRKAACILTTFEVALAHGADRCVGFSDLRVLPFFDTMSMGMELLGEPIAYGEGDGVAYQIALTREKLEAIRREWKLPSPSYITLRHADLGDLSQLERAAQLALETPAKSQLTPPHQTR